MNNSLNSVSYTHLEAGLVESGDDIVIVAGVPVGEAVRTNTMRIRTVR